MNKLVCVLLSDDRVSLGDPCTFTVSQLSWYVWLITEPLFRHLRIPLWADKHVASGVAFIAIGSVGICWGLLDTPETPWLAGMKPMIRFDGLIGCTTMTAWPYDVVTLVLIQCHS